MSSTLIVYFLTVGVLLPPIVIFSFLLCELVSLNSNLSSFFPFFGGGLAFWLFAYLHLRFFALAFLLLRFCYHAPTKNH